MRVLVTGAAGFTGRRLCDALGGGALAVTRRDADLADPAAAHALMAAVRPVQVYHLAGALTNEPDEAYRANVATTANLLGAARALRLRCRVLLVGSAAEYGHAQGRIAESRPPAPTSVYGLSKACQTLVMRGHAGVPGLEIVMARTFNLHGPGLSERLLPGRVAAWVAAGKPGRLSLGFLDAVRDYIAVDDAVAAYRRIMAGGVAGEVYNVGSGRGVQVRELVRSLAGDLDQIDEEPGAPGLGGALDEVVADISRLEGLPS